MLMADILFVVIFLGFGLGVIAVADEFLSWRSNQVATLKATAGLRGLYQRTLKSSRWLATQGTIEALAHDTRTAVAKVQEIFLTEYRKLAANARIRSYLPLLTSNIVRVILGAKWKTHPNLETSPLGANGAEPFRGRLTSTRR